MAEIYRSTAGRAAVQRWCEDQLNRWAMPHDCRRIPTGAGETHQAPHVEWMTMVARHTRSSGSGAPSPLAPAVVERWRDVPRAVLVGEQDCFLCCAG